MQNAEHHFVYSVSFHVIPSNVRSLQLSPTFLCQGEFFCDAMYEEWHTVNRVIRTEL